MNAFDMHFVAQLSVERLANCLAQGTVIALFAWLLLRMIGRRNSGTRFAVWFCALLAIAAIPFVEFSSSGAAAAHTVRAAITMPHAWSLYLFDAWATIAIFGLARVVVGLWHLRSIRRNCEPVDLTTLDPSIAQTLSDFHTVRSVELCVSEDLRVPTAVGFFRPSVVLPTWTISELSPAELNAVLLHELAHLRRWDDWTNLAQKVLRAVFFFHPAVWFIENRLSLEREMACDDLVLSQTANPRAYAECLVSLAEKNFLQRGLALAQAAVGRMRQTSLRVLQILDAGRSKSVGIWKPAPWVVAGFSVICLVSAEHAPRLVAFSDPAATRIDLSIASSRSAESEHAPPVVPVTFRVNDDRSNSLIRKADRKAVRQAAHSPAKSAATPTVYRAKAVDRTSPQAVPVAYHSRPAQPAFQRASSVPLVRTSASDLGDVAIMQQAVFVVVQDNPWSDGAPVVWRVSVWQVTLVPRTAPHVVSQTTSKSI
jgi:beta-lactamase regulating signal transducer with metallopeptidase domain